MKSERAVRAAMPVLATLAGMIVVFNLLSFAFGVAPLAHHRGDAAGLARSLLQPAVLALVEI